MFSKRWRHLCSVPIDKVKTENSDHTSGWHLSEEHLEIENTDRKDLIRVWKCCVQRKPYKLYYELPTFFDELESHF